MKQIILGAAALVLSVSALAEGYIGAAIGPSNVECNVSGCDAGDTGFKIYGGYVLPGSPLGGVALELGYIDFGKAKANGAIGPLSASYTSEVSAVTFAAALRAKFTPALSGVGRLGLAYVDGKGSATQAIGPFGVAGSTSSSDLKLYAGLGIEYAINKQFKVVGSADFTTYETGNESGSARLISVGAQYGF
jgi:OmpA-OmpF porin, OOP family